MRGGWILLAAAAALSPAASAFDTSFSQVERGRYLAAAGNCVSCHTVEGGQPYAGGYGMDTPFGLIYSSNITFDRDTGIGDWTRDDFYRAMHEGRSRDGSHLYPAFPYPYYTKMPRQDVDAIYDYLATLPPGRQEKPENELPWPLSIRTAVKGWNLLFFDQGVFEPDPERSPEWNRGAYLVDGPGHCGACHTGKNLLGADRDREYLQGGVLENWLAPDIRGGEHGGVAAWSRQDMVEYLRTGSNAHAGAFGTMSDVIAYSTQHLADADLEAIAIYLESLPGEERSPARMPSEPVMRAGHEIYQAQCAACHVGDGSGVPRYFAPLAGANNTTAEDPTTAIRVVLEGARNVPTQASPTPLAMPAFDWKLSDAEIAAVVSYVRSSWGNQAGGVSERQVRRLREALRED